MKTSDNSYMDAALDIYHSRPTVLNILDSVHANENEHTRFLCHLFNYRKNSIPIFLQAFLKRLSISEILSADDQTYALAKVEEQSGYIDCLIQCGRYVIIIENKICGACDQQNQISGYVDRVQKKYQFENTFVIYLTLFGGEPDKSSMPDELRSRLGERYVSITYRDVVLQWLQEDVLPECPYKDGLLIRSLQLYINYLHGVLGERADQQTLVERLAKTLNCSWGKASYLQLQNLLKQYSGNVESEEERVKQSDVRSILNILLREIEKRNPYFNEDNVAYVLKWMFRNDPPPPYKLKWVDGTANVAPFSSGTFMYSGGRFIGLTKPGVRIHMRCSIAGIKVGPYILADGALGNIKETEGIFGKQYLEANGLVCSPNLYGFPFDAFNESTTLIDVALHVKKLVDILNNSHAGSM